jgi:D-serine dehydratase
MYDVAAVEALRRTPIDVLEKGFGGPAHQKPVTPGELAATGPGLEDGWLGRPCPVLSEAALEHNVRTMAAYCQGHGVGLMPHGKTAMSPQLVARQLDAGARGVTVATVTQARLFTAFGVRQILVANQVTDSAGVAWLAEHAATASGSTVTCYVDSPEGLALLERAGSVTGACIPVLIEVGHEAGRTGVRDGDTATSLAVAVARAQHVELVGVAGYEGSLAERTPERTLAAVRRFCARLGDLTASLTDRGLLEGRPLLTAGGSAYFDAVVEELAGSPVWDLVLRSGCYLVHDDGLYRSVSPFTRLPGQPHLLPALRVRATVLSRPETRTAVVGAGRRDLSTDAGLPVVLAAQRAGDELALGDVTATRIFDQHLVVDVTPECPLRPGDDVLLGISHPCTTLDKWRWLPVVDEQGRVVDVVRTFF